MKSDRVRPVRRAGGEDAPQRVCGHAARMDLEHIPVAQVKPGQDGELRTGCDSIEGIQELRMDFNPCFRRSFAALFWGILPAQQVRPDDSDWCE